MNKTLEARAKEYQYLEIINVCFELKNFCFNRLDVFILFSSDFCLLFSSKIFSIYVFTRPNIRFYFLWASIAFLSFSCRKLSKACSASFNSASSFFSLASSSLMMVSNLVFSPSFTSRAYWRRNIFLVLWVKAERGSGFSWLSTIFSSSSDSSSSLSKLKIVKIRN